MTYLDHYDFGLREGCEQRQADCLHSWAAFTAKRLDWLYGPGRAQTPEAKADLAAWNRLGRRAAA